MELDRDTAAYLATVANIDRLNLDAEFVQFPADLAYCSGRYADALRDHLTAKVELSRTHACQRIYHRERLTADGGKVTESMVDAAVETDDGYQAAYLAAIEAEVDMVRWRGVCDALRAKKDMLVSLGANYRAEMQGDPMIKREASAASNFNTAR